MHAYHCYLIVEVHGSLSFKCYCWKTKTMKSIISNNDLTIAKNDITRNSRDLRNYINECQQIIHKDDRWRCINLNSTALTIRGLIKIHKEDCPIWPIVNRKNAPAYKQAKMLSKKLKLYISIFNVKNTVHLINNLMEIPYDSNLKFASFDITKMYSNVTTNKLLKIINVLYETRN